MANIESGSTYEIINAKSGTALDLAGNTGREITGYQRHGGDNQKWLVEQKDNGYTLKSVATGGYLKADGGPGDGIAVIASEGEFTWELVPENDKIRITVPGTPFNLDLDQGRSDNDVPVQTWGRWDAEHQTWTFNKV